MNSISSSFLLLTIVFLAKNIECEDDIHFELSVEYFVKSCTWDDNSNLQCQKRDNSWIISDFLPQLNNATNSSCLRSNWTLTSPKNPSPEWYLRGKKIPNAPRILMNRYEEFRGCISGIKAVNTLAKYFTEPSILYSKYTMNDIFPKSNITPGNNYTYQEISDAVSNVTLGKKPIIKCLWNKELNLWVLDKITLFFDKLLNLIDPLKSDYPEKCPTDLPIFFENFMENFSQPRSYYEGRLDKYAPFQEDDDGYYVLWQENEPALCYKNPFKCNKVKYMWPVHIFTFVFKDDIESTCNWDADNSHGFENSNATSLSSIKDEIAEKWGVSARQSSSIEEQLEEYWNSMGKCATDFKGIDTKFKFFKKSLDVFDKYSMDAILRQSNIIPGKNYTYQEIFDAVSKGINGKKPIIECEKVFERFTRRENVLSRIAFYLDKNFNPVDQTDTSNLGTNHAIAKCKPDELIYYQNFEDFSSDVMDYGEMFGIKDYYYWI